MKYPDFINETSISIDHDLNKVILDTTDKTIIKLLSEELVWQEDVNKNHEPYRRFLATPSQVSFKSKKKD